MFCKSVACYNSCVLKQPRQQSARAGVWGGPLLRRGCLPLLAWLAGFYRRPTRVPGSTGFAGDHIATRLVCAPLLPAPSQSTGSGALGGLPRRRPRAEHLLLQCVSHDVFIFSIVVFVLTDIYERLTAPATDQLPRSAGGYAGDDDIVACTPEFEKIVVVASGAAIPCGGHSGSSWFWPNTFRLDCSALGQPIGPVTQRYISWVAKVIRPMKQRVPDTCALVACTVAVEAMHRFLYGAARHFRWTAEEPEQLLRVCRKNKIWKRGEGAPIEMVLNKIQDLNGVPIITKNPALSPRLPLRAWDVHELDDDDSERFRRLSAERVAELLRGGPCVGRLWTCPWYHRFDASLDNGAWVYRGCGRSQAARDECESLYGVKVGFRAVVCFGYRLCGDQMHVLVLDNHEETGPWRWVDVEELYALYTLDLGCPDLDKCPLLQKES